MNDERKAEFGSISTCTLRTQDLIRAFTDELEHLEHGGTQAQEITRNINESIWEDDNDPYWDSEDAQHTLEELFDALNEYAPPYGYFGAHEGDGADFGFWPISEIFDNPEDPGVTKVNDLSEAIEPGEYLVVNDHGNCTFGYVDDSGEFHEVWAIV